MPDDRVKSISASELSRTVKAAVSKTLEEHRKLTLSDFKLSIAPDPGIVGFIIRDADFADFKASELAELSTSVTREMGDLGRFARPIAILRDGGATIGFIPPREILIEGL